MKNLLKAVLTAAFFIVMLSSVNSYSQDINGVWLLGSEGNQSLQLMSDGKFVETNGNAVKTGTWSLSYDNTLYMYYDVHPYSTSKYDRLVIDGNTVYLYTNDGSRISWARTVEEMDVPDRYGLDRSKHTDTQKETTLEDINKVDRRIIKDGNTNDQYINETTEEDSPNVDESKENHQNYPNRRELDKNDP